MKTFFIGMVLISCFYSAQSIQVKKQTSGILQNKSWDDTLAYGPQLPCYYSNSVSEYVRRIFQDSKGNLWFGTNTDGLAMYDGKNLNYINTREGLSGSQVTGIIEDRQGNLWFSTNHGITRYDPSTKAGMKEYQNFGEKEGLCSASVWSVFQDRNGVIWAGTYSGLCRFNGEKFESFPILHAEKSWIRAIAEDKEGHLWIATADAGAFQFDGKNFIRFSKKDGLCSNDLTVILPDSKGNIWFGSMDGGLSKYDGKRVTNLTVKKGIGDNEVWTIYEDQSGTIWFSSEGFGIYSYTDGKLTHFGKIQGLPIDAVQSIYQDRSGRMWIGGGGLYLYSGGGFSPVTKNGPWDDGC